MDAFRNWAANLYRTVLPAGQRQTLSKWMANQLISLKAPNWASDKTLPPQPGPLIVSGFFNRSSGLGQAVRATADALDALGLTVIRHDLDPVLSASPLQRQDLPAPAQGGVWIVHCNPDEALTVFSKIPLSQWQDRYRIGYWVYEVVPAPEHWARASPVFHEIWTPSQYSARALAPRVKNRPLKIAPHPAPRLGSLAPDRARFGLKPSDFVFLSLFDGHSSITRKNPMAALEAFLQAFPEPSTNAILVIKALRPIESQAYADLVRKGVRSGQVLLMTEELSEADMTALIGCVDVLVSLHRAEGFGLTLLEAMSLGKGVIATDWSGNLDFMTSDTSRLVPASLTAVSDPTGVYPPESVWAEPDIQTAAQYMLELYTDPSTLKGLGARARKAASRHSSGFTRDENLLSSIKRLILP